MFQVVSSRNKNVGFVGVTKPIELTEGIFFERVSVLLNLNKGRIEIHSEVWVNTGHEFASKAMCVVIISQVISVAKSHLPSDSQLVILFQIK